MRVSNAKARRELGWAPRVPTYREGVEAMAALVGVASRLLPVLEILDAAAVRRWCASGLAALRRHQREIDDLNVYPVPDGDTGTNLVLTLASADEALGRPADALDRARRGSADHGPRRAARRPGQLGRDRLAGVPRARRHARRHRAVRRAGAGRGAGGGGRGGVQAVAEPVEGTILRSPPPRPRRPARADSDDLAEVIAGRRGRAPPRRWPAPPSSCRRWPAPGWSTRAGAACPCCSTPWSRW